MKYCRFLFEGQVHYGRIEDRGGEPWIVDLMDAPEEDFAFHLERALAAAKRKLAVDPAGLDFDPLPLSAAQLLAPVTPSKIICVGRNYRDHAKELGNEVPTEPLLFFKPTSSLLAPGGVVRMPAASQRVDFEGELAFVIGKRTSRFNADGDWRSTIRGYTLANDVTARDLQKKEGQWTRGKGWDTFCPVGPFVSDEIDPAAGVVLETRVNGEVRQHGSTADFIFSVPQLLEYITQAITLEPGDLVLTGTPAGVGPLVAGDRVDVSVAGLGVLSNTFQPE
ncbi:fumarylacetoacetate hydrolase family protein [Occallatibacter riparius]|uniref:Fumarylacetoacetate hydrolase family protein n=1 Tax=Occallatibacter riparius TaxID=1002689 RepID=A0A9J7BTE5_9BACT|nr:fumarylacetoacetate hydrolase family protein [Occallatibacter riparius]UWZ85920.1 fumarylacetoacetate hydrolase family protein [Occallatibacter riparius]